MNIQRQIKILCLMTLLITTKINAEHLNTHIESKWTQWPVVGQATLSWLWLDIYSSQLRSPNGKYQLVSDVSPHPVALEIRYLRDISRDQLLDATLEQWQKQGYGDNEIQRWVETLTNIFPSVKTGEQLVYVSDGHRGEFIYKTIKGSEESIGHIENEALNDAFLSIWLSPKTEYQALRQQLIGMNRP